MRHDRENIPLDVLFVGAGPANLSGAIHLAKLAQRKGLEIEIGVIEKAAAIGAHSLSGAILDPVALKELIPDYKEKGFPIETESFNEKFYYLTRKRSYAVPFIPQYMHSDGCFIVSLSKVVQWLAQEAEELGVLVLPGFAGTQVLFNSEGDTVIGVGTGDKGINKNGLRKANFEPGTDLTAKVTVFGEGPKGSLLREVGRKMGIFNNKMPQAFETAIKEVIQLPETSQFLSGANMAIHTFGYPLGLDTKGGGFIYRLGPRKVALGVVVGLDYQNPLLEPYESLIQFKLHPMVRDIIAGGKVVQQGAKTLSAGGIYTMPRLAINGAVFVGDSASMLNIQRLKGIHTAMKSGMLAAEAIIDAFERKDFSNKTLDNYETAVEKSWIHQELRAARNFSQALGKKGVAKFVHIGAQYVSNGHGFKDPLPIEKDAHTLKILNHGTDEPIQANKTRTEFDGTLYIDKMTGVYLSGTQHEEDQPCHLKITDFNICLNECFKRYANPCTRFCPAQVYEIESSPEGDRRLKLNPTNCLHCKTCEIKDPYENITWTCPEGGGGPGYLAM